MKVTFKDGTETLDVVKITAHPEFHTLVVMHYIFSSATGEVLSAESTMTVQATDIQEITA